MYTVQNKYPHAAKKTLVRAIFRAREELPCLKGYMLLYYAQSVRAKTIFIPHDNLTDTY